MKYTAEKNYLTFPVSRNAKVKTVRFFDETGNCVLSLPVRLDFKSGENEIYIDVRRFKGVSLDIEISPEMPVKLREKDRRPVCRFSERLRPEYHLTAPSGTLFSCSCAVFSSGKYHIFYAVNPYGSENGSIHWGHTALKNLVDPEYENDALLPSADEISLFGGVLTDEKNLLGSRINEKTPVVFYHTAVKNEENTEKTRCDMTVSCDGCEEFTRLPFAGSFRDISGNAKNPFVFYSTRYDIYVLILETGPGICTLYRSKNLRDWTKLQNFTREGGFERPLFFPLVLDGAQEKWVLMDSYGRYEAGEFDTEAFTSESTALQSLDCSENANSCPYVLRAADDMRTLMLSHLPTLPFSFGEGFSGALAFPRELRLVTDDGEMKIFAEPARELERLCGRKIKENKKTDLLYAELRSISGDIVLEIAPQSAKKAEICLFGEKFILDFENSAFAYADNSVPFSPDQNGKYFLQILTDSCGFEIFLSHGKNYVSLPLVPDSNLNILQISSDCEMHIKLDAAKLRPSRKSDRRR